MAGELLFSLEGFVQVVSCIVKVGVKFNLSGLTFYAKNIESFIWFSFSYVQMMYSISRGGRSNCNTFQDPIVH